MTSAANIRTIALEGLKGATTAGDSVFSPLDVPTWQGEYPMLIVLSPKAHGEGLGNVGIAKFDTLLTLRIVARVSRAATTDDEGAALVYSDLETLVEQVLAALVNFPPLRRVISEYAYFDWDLSDVSKEDSGFHIGEASIELGVKWTQGPADFYQADAPALSSVQASIPAPAGTDGLGATIESTNKE